MKAILDGNEINLDALMESARKYGTQAAKQAKIVEEMLEQEGAEPVGLAYFVANKNGDLFSVDPWGNVAEYRTTEADKKEEVTDLPVTSNE